MRIRDATPDDAEAIRDVHARAIGELGTQAYSQAQVEAWAAGCASTDYTDPITAPETEYVVAEREGSVVGFGTLGLATPTGYEATVDAEITAVYVDPSVARDGVGTAIYEELERRARASGVETLGLQASLNAVPFYEAHGYERVRELTHEFSAHESTGVTGVVVEMRKRI